MGYEGLTPISHSRRAQEVAKLMVYKVRVGPSVVGPPVRHKIAKVFWLVSEETQWRLRGAPLFAKVRQVSAVGGSPSESKCLDSGAAKNYKN